MSGFESCGKNTVAAVQQWFAQIPVNAIFCQTMIYPCSRLTKTMPKRIGVLSQYHKPILMSLVLTERYQPYIICRQKLN